MTSGCAGVRARWQRFSPAVHIVCDTGHIMLETRPGPWESGGTLVEKIQRIRTILKQHGRLARDAESLDEHADLYQAGMTSHASVNVMLALEGEFDVEFPDEMLKRSSFESIAAIASAVESLTANPA